MTDIILQPKKNVIMDATVLSSLMSCGRLSDFRFNLNLQPIEGKSNSLEVGSLVHKVLEVTYGNIIKGVKRTDAIGYGMIAGELYIRGCPYCTDFEPILEAPLGCDHKFIDSKNCLKCGWTPKLKPECGHQVNEYPGVTSTPQVIDKSNPREKYLIGWKWALETCEQYFDHYKNDSWVPIEVEVTKGKVLYEDDDLRVLWKAKLDWIVDTNQGIYPVDHKTMKQRRDSISLNNQFIGQCLIAETRNVIINKIGFQATLKPEEKFERTPISYTADRLIEWQSQILPYWAYQMLQYHEAEYWAPNFTHCENKYGLCQFKKVCESNPDDRERELRVNFKIGKKWDVGGEDE